MVVYLKENFNQFLLAEAQCNKFSIIRQLKRNGNE